MFKAIQEFKGEIFGHQADCRDAFYATNYLEEVILVNKPKLLDEIDQEQFFTDFYACCKRAYFKSDCYNPSEFESEIDYTFVEWAESGEPLENLRMMGCYACYFEWFNDKLADGSYKKPKV